MSMGNEEAGGVGEELGQGSPRNKVKFLCSYGGKILPRPSDGSLKYVGGETRVVAVPRDISFFELMKKLSALIDRDMVLKYRIIPEDLDALVSVISDEDLKHMIDEHDRHQTEGIPKLRTFLFPPNSVILENQVTPIDPQMTEQRYFDAINGVLRTPVSTRLHPIIANRPSFSISACSSPKSNSPEGNNHDLVPPEAAFPNSYQTSRLSMHKVQSSPNICSLNSHPHQNNNLHHYPPHHHYYQNHSQYQPHTYLPSRPFPPLDFHKGVGNAPGMPLGWGPPSHGLNQYYPTSRHNSGGGGGSRCGYEDCAGYGCGHIDRSGSIPQSPRKHGVRL